MKIGVILIGVARPTAERVIQNIEQNISFFKKNYPEHIFEFIICTYKNVHFEKIDAYCKSHGIQSYFLEPILNKDIPPEMVLPPPNVNRYRMFFSMNYVMERLPECYDCVIRIRIDTEMQKFELADPVSPCVYYTAIHRDRSCSDNIGFASQKVMKKVWALENCFTKGKNPETILYSIIHNLSYIIKPFQFEFYLYQDDTEYCDGVPQWSRRNRVFSYNGVSYEDKIMWGL